MFMYEGIDDDIDLYEGYDNGEQQFEESQFQDTSSQEPVSEESLVNSLLSSIGIEDKSKIKFDNDNGEIEEVDWNNLSLNEQMNIIYSSLKDDDSTKLDNDEIMLLNDIRSKNLNPKEYIQNIQYQAINQYLNNQKESNPSYSIDQYSDDELYVLDMLSRTKNMTEDEAIEALNRAKVNETLYKKQIDALREEYQQKETEAIQEQKYQQQQIAQEQYQQFAKNVENAIINFTEFSGYDLNMDYQDKSDLYEFLTGFDQSGNSWFGKALNDMDSVVKMGWFLMNGEKMIADITQYYNKEIESVRKNSYNKGLKDGQNQKNSLYIPKSSPKSIYDDLDDFA